MPEPFTIDTLLHAFEPVFAQLPVLVAPHQPHAVVLAPEFSTPQDGHDKQDCEQAAYKWVNTLAALGGVNGLTHRHWNGRAPHVLR